MRQTAIHPLGAVSWGTHLCHFYQTDDELAALLVPYFTQGLRDNEYCLWITSDPLDEKTAADLLRRAVPDLDRHLERG